jgi:hypothetical protein
MSVSVALERTARAKVVTCPNPSQRIVEAGDFHGLIAAAAIAYKQHYPLVLCPDMIWLTILQGLAQHVANHPESLRSRLVSHQTKIELVVDRDRLPQTSAEMMTATSAFLGLIEKHALPNKHFLLRTEFSTTTDVDRIAGAVVMMDAFSPYFDYVMRIICGIPSVILEGTTSDWELLTAKVRMLHESDLDISWWTRHLLPLCVQFERASRGEVDRSHWNNLCKLVERYGMDDLNGWILKFIPYVRHDKNALPKDRNPVLELTEFPLDTEKMGKITGCTSNMLPTGLSGAPVICLNRETGESTSYQFVAGFVGVSQSSEDLSLRPAIGWAITEGARIDRLLARLRSEHEAYPPERMDTEDLLRIFDRNLPADIWRFYTETSGGILKCKKPHGDTVSCVIKPVNQTKLAIEFASVECELKHSLKQGVLTPTDYEARRRFALAYSHLRVFAESHEGKSHYFYVFGNDPERFDGLEVKESRGSVFRWNGEPTRDSFDPVAPTFSQWFEDMLDRTKSDNSS